MSERNNSVDIFRLLAAFCVILIHTQFVGLSSHVSIGLRLLYRWPVPFFFILSGYFSAKYFTKPDWIKIIQSILRLVMIFFIWNLIFAVPEIINEGFRIFLKRYIEINTLVSGTHYHLWFISSLILGYLIIAGIYYFHLEKWLPGIALGILIFGLLTETYNFIDLKTDIFFTRHFTSISFMALGIYFFNHGIPTLKNSILLILSGLFIEAAEVYLFNRFYGTAVIGNYLLIGKVLLTAGIAGFTINNYNLFDSAWLGEIGRTYSLGIYLIHPLINPILKGLASSVFPGIFRNTIYSVFHPFLLFMISLSILILIKRFLPPVFKAINGIRANQAV